MCTHLVCVCVCVWVCGCVIMRGLVITSAATSLEDNQPHISHEPREDGYFQTEAVSFPTVHADAAPFCLHAEGRLHGSFE